MQVATEVHDFAVTIPVGTPADAPYVETLTLDYRTIVTIDLMVPPGPGGVMGFAVLHSGTQVFPYNSGTWFVWDGTDQSWDLADLPDSQGWQIAGYNEGNYPHTVYVRLHTVPVTSSAAAPPAPVAYTSSEPAPLTLADLTPIS